MLAGGFVCNLLIKPLAAKWFMKPEEVAALQAKLGGAAKMTPAGSFGIGQRGLDAEAMMFWAIVGIPLAWGVWKTLVSAIKIFWSGHCGGDPCVRPARHGTAANSATP